MARKLRVEYRDAVYHVMNWNQKSVQQHVESALTFGPPPHALTKPERFESFSPRLARFGEGLPWVASFKIFYSEGVVSIPNIPCVQFNFVSACRSLV
jgi:hypothetical protein